MGDYADDALDYAASTWELATSSYSLSLAEKYELGLCDERGYEPDPGSFVLQSHFGQRRQITFCGPGKCPKCGNETTLKQGKFGKFYGCKAFPFCKGSRNY